MARKPLVAIVGRPNVGKSTLFNRLVGQRMAVTHDIPGTTRDRLQGQSEWNGVPFHIIDTGGIEVYEPKGVRDVNPLSEGSKEFVPLIRAQALLAVEEADAVIFVVDNVHGVTAADEAIAEILRRTKKPLLIASNKADDVSHEAESFEFYNLGLGPVFPVSAIHGAGVGDLLDELITQLRQTLPELASTDDEEQDHLRIAIVGRPNAGKSTLLNKLVGEDRAIVSPIAGTTRDSIDSEIKWHGQQITLIDTAGIRRRGRIEPGVEQFSVIRSMQAIERCDVALLMIDAEEGITEQDEHIAGYVIQEFKSLILVVNKWDTVAKDAYTMNEFTEKMRDRFHFVPYAPILYISALTGQRIHTILETATRVYENRYHRVTTGEFNQILREALDRHAPPTRGTRRLKVFYGAQVKVAPPMFLLHINDKHLVHFSYERYLENRIREAFPFEGTPIRISFRQREQKDTE